MSEVIDSKVVELKFNNAEFEKNVKTSLSTIERLKKSLNFDTVTTGLQTLTGVASAFSLKNITDQVSNIANTVDQSVTPIQAAVDTIASTITNTIGGAINGVVSQIESGGIRRAFNIEAAKFSLQGLGIEWSSVSKSINNAVSGTAYGLDQAAKAAAVLSASGIGTDVVGKDVLTGEPLEELERDLKAVSGIAAQTGQDFDRIADVFSTIANNGKVMTMQVRQFSTYGLNATADLADYYGVAMSDIEDMLQKSEISANDFFDMMYNKYWENAGKANETVTGVEANIKAALGRIGAAFISPIVENKGPLNQFLNSYMAAINTVAGKLKQIGSKDEKGNLVEGKLTTYVTKELIKYFEIATDWLDEFTKKPAGLLRVWRSVYRFLKGTFKIAQSAINFLEKIGQAFNRAFPAGLPTYLLRLTKVWTNFTNGIFKASKDITTRNNVFNVFLDIFTGIRRVIKAVIEQIKALIQGFKDFTSEVPFHPFKAIGDAFEYIGKAAKKFEANSDGFKNIFKGLWIIISNVATTVFAFGQAVVETMQEMDIHPIQWFGKVLKTLTSGLETNEKKVTRLKNVFKVFTTILGAIVKVAGGLILVIAKVFNIFFKLANIVSYILAPLGKLISSITELAVEIGKSLLGNLGKIGKKFEGVNKPVEKLRGAVEDFVDKAIGGIESLKDNLKSNIDNIKKAISNIDLSKFENLKRMADGVKGVFDSIKEAVGNAMDAIADFFSSGSGGSGVSFSNSDLTSGLEGILGFFDDIAGAVLTVKDNIVDFLQPAIDGIKTAFQNAFGSDTQTDISNTNDKLNESVEEDGLLGTLQSIIEGLGGIFGKVLQKIGDVFGKISEGLLDQMDLDEDASVYEVILGSINLVVGFIGDVLQIIIDNLGEVLEKAGEVVKKGSVQDLIEEAINILVQVRWTAIFMAVWDAASAMRNLTKALKQSNKVYFSARFKNVATGVAILLASVIGSVIALEAALVGILEIQKRYKEDDIKTAAKTLAVMFGGMLLLTAILLGILSDLNGPSTKAFWDKKNGLSFEKVNRVTDGLAGILIAFSGSILILTWAFENIIKAIDSCEDKDGNFDEDKFDKAKKLFGNLLAGTVIFAVLFELMNALGKLADEGKSFPEKFKETLSSKGLFSTLLAFGGSIWIMSKALQNIVEAINSCEDPKKLKSATTVFYVMIGVLAGIVLVMTGGNLIGKKLEKGLSKGQNISKAIDAATLLAIAWAVKILAEAFTIIVDAVKNAKVTQIIGAGVIMAAMAAALVGIIAALKAIYKNPTKNDNIAQFMNVVMINTIADSIRVLVNTFTDLLKHLQKCKDPKKIHQAEIIMTVMAAALLVILIAMNAITKRFGSSDPGKHLKGLLLILAEGGVFLLCLWATIELFGELLKKIKGRTEDEIKNAETIMAVMAAALLGILLAMTGIDILNGTFAKQAALGSLVTLLEGGEFLALLWGSIELFGKLIKKTRGISSEKVEKVTDAIETMMTSLGDILESTSISNTVKGTAGWISGGITYIGDLVTALEGGGLYVVFTGLINKYKGLLEAAKDMDPDAIEATGDVIVSIIEAYKDMMTYDDIDEAVIDTVGTVAKFANAIASLLQKHDIQDLIDNYTDLIDKTKDYSIERIETTAKIFRKIIRAYASLCDDLSGFNVSIGNIDTKELTKIVKDIIKSYVELLNASTVPEEKEYPKMDKMLPWAETVANNASDALDEEVENSKTTFNTIGENITAGVADGMVSEDAKQNIKDAAEEVKDTAKESLEGSLDEHSPSKLMRDTIGKNITAGIAVGMTKYVAPILNSSKAIGTTVLNSLANTKELASSVMDNWSLDPTITPVIDMSNVEAASGQLAGMFSSQTIGINANLNGISRSMRQIQNNDPNADLMSAINGLKDNINNNYTSYNVNGITYDDGSNIATAVQELISATNVQRRM